MKRVWIVSCIVAAIIGMGVFSIMQLGQVKDEMEKALEHLSQVVLLEDSEQLSKEAEEFEHLWETKELMIMRYIHHDELDSITGKVARLRALAKYEDYAEFAAEIDSLRHLIEHIYESEQVSWQSIF